MFCTMFQQCYIALPRILHCVKPGLLEAFTVSCALQHECAGALPCALHYVAPETCSLCNTLMKALVTHLAEGEDCRSHSGVKRKVVALHDHRHVPSCLDGRAGQACQQVPWIPG